MSPNVVAVGGTSLFLNQDGSYNSETGWGYSNASGTFIGSGGGVSQYEAEPAYQQAVQSTGFRTIPDVSFDADPTTGVWIADPYNLPAGNPWETVGGTSLSAPAWAGLIALADQGRVESGEGTLGSSTDPTATQTALYDVPASDYNAVASGYNGYSAGAGYNLETGLGTPNANLLVSDLIANTTAPTCQRSITVTASDVAGYVGGGGEGANVMNVFDAIASSSTGEVPDTGRSGSNDLSTIRTPSQLMTISPPTPIAASRDSGSSALSGTVGDPGHIVSSGIHALDSVARYMPSTEADASPSLLASLGDTTFSGTTGNATTAGGIASDWLENFTRNDYGLGLERNGILIADAGDCLPTAGDAATDSSIDGDWFENSADVDA